MKRLTKGDASETGIIRFITPLLMKEYQGIWNVEKSAEFAEKTRLDQFRAAYPVLVNAAKENAQYAIPFNSSIKFNLLIRDANPNVPNPSSTEDNIILYLKGAPEKVLKRCDKVLMPDLDGTTLVETEFDARMKYNVEAANDRFGLMGERVLAFAKTCLSPSEFLKNQYDFNTPEW